MTYTEILQEKPRTYNALDTGIGSITQYGTIKFKLLAKLILLPVLQTLKHHKLFAL
jgi:hypothetical protein